MILPLAQSIFKIWRCLGYLPGDFAEWPSPSPVFSLLWIWWESTQERWCVLRHHVRDAACSIVPELVMQARLLAQGTTSHVFPPLGDSAFL